jgi:hypothetical protein
VLKKSLFALVLVLFTVVPAFGQALPFTKKPVTQEQLAKAIEKNDRSILNVSADEMVRAANEAFGFDMESPKELAEWVRNLTDTSCPAGYTSTLARVLKSGEVDLYGFKRPFRVGEQCLLDANLARYVLSRLCGNFVTQADLPLFGAVSKSPSALDPSLGDRLFSGGPQRHDNPSIDPQHSQGSWWSRNKKWALPVIGGVAAGAIVCTVTGCGMKQTVNVTIR